MKDFAVEKRNSLTKIFFPVDLHFGAKFAGDGVHNAEFGPAAFGHVDVGAGAFVELAIMKQQSFREGSRVMGEDFHDGIVDDGGRIIDGSGGGRIVAVTGIACCQQTEDQQKRDRSVHK